MQTLLKYIKLVLQDLQFHKGFIFRAHVRIIYYLYFVVYL